jgi:hypothetical protein
MGNDEPGATPLQDEVTAVRRHRHGDRGVGIKDDLASIGELGGPHFPHFRDEGGRGHSARHLRILSAHGLEQDARGYEQAQDRRSRQDRD